MAKSGRYAPTTSSGVRVLPLKEYTSLLEQTSIAEALRAPRSKDFPKVPIWKVTISDTVLHVLRSLKSCEISLSLDKEQVGVTGGAKWW